MTLKLDSKTLLTLEKSGRFVDAIAYAGGIIYPSEFPKGLIIDLSSTTISKSVPLLLGHEVYSVAGITEGTQVSNNAIKASGVLHKNNEFADEIKSKKDWQLSIGVFAKSSKIPADKQIVNGLEITEPVHVWSDATVKEISVTHFPVDDKTNIQFLEKKDKDMPEDTTALNLLKEQVAQRNAEIATLKETITIHEATIAERDATIATLTAEITTIQAGIAETKLSQRKESIAKLSKELGKKAEDYDFMIELSDDSFKKAVDSFTIVKPEIPDNLLNLSHFKDDKNQPKAKKTSAEIYAERNKMGAK